jgi:hypothetical protein
LQPFSPAHVSLAQQVIYSGKVFNSLKPHKTHSISELIYKENLKELQSFAVLALQPVITRRG